METTFGGNQAAASIQMGQPRPVQTMFLVEEAIQVLLTNTFAIERVQRILCILDQMEQKIEAAACQLQVSQVGDITLRDGLPDLLEHEYQRWAKRLADILGVPIYPFAARFKPGRSVNIRVRH